MTRRVPLKNATPRFWWHMEPKIIRRGEWFVAQVKYGDCKYEAYAHSEQEARRLHRWGLNGYRCEVL